MIPGPRRLLSLLVALILTGALSCGDDGTSPPPPTLFEATLRSPAGDVGGVLVKLTGPVDRVTAPAADTLLLRTRSDTTWVFVALRTPGSPGFTVRTPELAGRPEATILQVVGPDDELRTDLESYVLELEP